MTECVCVCWADLCCLHTFSHLPWNAGGENTTGWTLVSKRKKVKSVRGCWWWWVAPNSSLQFVWIFRLHNFFVLRSSIPSRSVKYHDNKWSAVSPFVLPRRCLNEFLHLSGIFQCRLSFSTCTPSEDRQVAQAVFCVCFVRELHWQIVQWWVWGTLS